MSWSLLLSQYPKSILQDEKAVLVLALLEREGLATEDDLVSRSGLAKAYILDTLNRLQLNGLVEYGGEHIRLAQRGQFLVDRFDLTETILDDILFQLESDQSRRDTYKRILRSYRKESPALFQNSVCTLRVWNVLLNSLMKVHDSNLTHEEMVGTTRSLLLRDLRNWSFHRPKGEAFLSGLDPKIRILVFNHDVNAEDCVIRHDSPHNLGIYYLTFLDESVRAGHTLQQFRSKTRLSPLLESLHSMQCKYEPYTWFDAWSTAKDRIPSSARFRSVENYVKRAMEVIVANFELPATSSAEENSAVFKRKWDADDLPYFPSEDLIRSIIRSTSLDEFCESAGLNQPNAMNFLELLRGQCERLISTAGAKANIGESKQRDE